MVTAGDFRDAVQKQLQQAGAARLPAGRQLLVVGVTPDSRYVRLLITNPWWASMMVRGVMRRYRLDHLAVVASVAAQPGPQRRFVIGWAQKQQSGDRAAPSDPRLAKLVMVARREWDDPSRRTPAPMRLLFGRPWLLMLLLASLSIQLFFDLLRIPLVVSGRYSWLPMLPTQPANALFALYVGLLAATIVTLWRRSAIGYGLALWLSAAQLVHVFAFHETLLNTLWSLTVPALIWLCLVLLYLDARIRELEEEV